MNAKMELVKAVDRLMLELLKQGVRGPVELHVPEESYGALGKVLTGRLGEQGETLAVFTVGGPVRILPRK